MKLKNEPHPVLDPALEAELLAALAPIEPAPARAAAMGQRILERIAVREEDFLTVHRDQGDWRIRGPGIAEKRLVNAPGIYACLLRLEPGAALPPHDHPTARRPAALRSALRPPVRRSTRLV